MFHDIMIAFICIGAYAILILYGIKRTENRNMLARSDSVSRRCWDVDT